MSDKDLLPEPGDAPVGEWQPRYGVVAECRDEREQKILIEVLMKHGFEVRALFR